MRRDEKAVLNKANSKKAMSKMRKVEFSSSGTEIVINPSFVFIGPIPMPNRKEAIRLLEAIRDFCLRSASEDETLNFEPALSVIQDQMDKLLMEESQNPRDS